MNILGFYHVFLYKIEDLCPTGCVNREIKTHKYVFVSYLT